MLIGVCSAKGSPGVTSTALAIAANTSSGLLIEADPSGGDLAYRCEATHSKRVYPTPGLTSLAAAARGGLVGPEVIGEHAQELKCGVRLVQGAISHNQGRVPFSEVGVGLVAVLKQSREDIVVDLGRLNRGTATVALAAEVDVLVWVCSSSVESLHHMREEIRDLAPILNARKLASIVPALVTESKKPGAELAAVDEFLTSEGLPVQAAAHIAYDPAGVARVEGGLAQAGRSRLVRSAVVLLEQSRRVRAIA